MSLLEQGKQIDRSANGTCTVCAFISDAEPELRAEVEELLYTRLPHDPSKYAVGHTAAFRVLKTVGFTGVSQEPIRMHRARHGR